MKEQNIKVKYQRYMKARLSSIRITGLVMCFFMVFLLIMPYIGFETDALMNGISLIYVGGFLFTLNSQYQTLAKNEGWSKTNKACAFLLYLATIALLVLFILKAAYIIQL